MAITWVYMLGIFHMCTHWHTHTHIVWLSHWLKHSLRRCKNELKKFTASQQLHVPWPHRNLCNAWCGMCQWLGRILYLRAFLGHSLMPKENALANAKHNEGGYSFKIVVRQWHTHTYIYIYIMGYNCIAISGKKLFWHSVWHSFWRSGPGVPTAPIWRWGPAGDIDMVFGRRIRSWRYGA